MHGFNCAEACGILVSLTKDQTHVPCIGRQILKPLGRQRSPWIIFMSPVHLILLEHLSVSQFLWLSLHPLHPWVSPPVPWSTFRQSFPVLFTAAAPAQSLQSCPTLCDPIDGSPPGSPVPGILQAPLSTECLLTLYGQYNWSKLEKYHKIKGRYLVRNKKVEWN